MKNNLRIMFTIYALCLIFGSAASVFGQPRAGGYKEVSVSSPDVKAAADFAVEQKAAEMEAELSLEGIK